MIRSVYLQEDPLDAFSPAQQAILTAPPRGRIFLSGPAGCGKTSAGVARLLHLVESGVPAEQILVLVPQRTLARPYYDLLAQPGFPPGGSASVMTLGGLAQRLIALFWPLIAAPAGFGAPAQPPTFLTLESAQYYLARLVKPLLDQGYFETVHIDRNRLFSQILDNLNKAAAVGFAHTQIGERLSAAWIGKPEQLHVYAETQDCADRFRAYCLANNLLDFSLQLEVFVRQLWPAFLCREYLFGVYRHLIFDNVEEDVPVVHDVVAQWLARFESALLIYDSGGGYRSFLGADPASGWNLQAYCDQAVTWEQSWVVSQPLAHFHQAIAAVLQREEEDISRKAAKSAKEEDKGRGEGSLQSTNRDTGDANQGGFPQAFSSLASFAALREASSGPSSAALREASSSPSSAALRETPFTAWRESLRAVQIVRQAYYPQLLDWVSLQVQDLLRQGVQPGEIAVLSPFLSDALRFSLMDRLTSVGVPVRSHRPSRSLREEPATHCLLTLARLAHPTWNLACAHFDVRMALIQAIADLDLVRADVLARIVFRPNRPQDGLSSFEQIRPEVQERISYQIGQRYEILRCWLEDYRQGPPFELDIFLSRLFGEVLSQPGFGFHQNMDGAAVAARLIESIQKFRWAAAGPLEREQRPVGLEYIQMVSEGVIAAQYLQAWQDQSPDAVFLAPAYTFLMSNRPVDFQFWLDIGSLGWWERLYQPLTHPVVLSRHWPAGRLWTDADEFAANQEGLTRLVTGLVQRCRQGIYLCSAGLNEQGDEPRGPLLQALQSILRRGAAQEVA